MSFSEYISPLVGRLMLAWFFLAEAIDLAGSWDPTIALMELRHVPAAPAVLALVLIVLFLGALSLLLGYQARYGAIFLFGLTVAATLVMHDFWTIRPGPDRVADYELFSRNAAIAGGLLVIVGLGPGRFAIDNVGKKR